MVDEYELKWSIDRQQRSEFLSGTMDSYTIPGLNMYDNTTINITVAAINGEGSSESTPLTIHSDLLQNNRNTVSNIDIIIGGAVGIFLIGLMIGITVGTIFLKFIQHCRNRKIKNK